MEKPRQPDLDQSTYTKKELEELCCRIAGLDVNECRNMTPAEIIRKGSIEKFRTWSAMEPSDSIRTIVRRAIIDPMHVSVAGDAEATSRAIDRGYRKLLENRDTMLSSEEKSRTYLLSSSFLAFMDIVEDRKAEMAAKEKKEMAAVEDDGDIVGDGDLEMEKGDGRIDRSA